MNGKLKTAILPSAYRFSSRLLQAPVPTWSKRWYWSRVCGPYLSWRELRLPCRTQFGAPMWAQPTQFVENRILFFGVWEPNITAWFMRLLKPGDVVLDVGANVGYYTLLSSKLVGSAGKVYAVKPSPSIRGRLENNLRLNHPDNVSVLPFAAWSSQGQATFHIHGKDCGSSSLSTLEDCAATETVDLVRLDDVLDRRDAARLRIVKLDIEGAEYHALQGLRATLAAAPNAVVLCELNPALLSALGGSIEEVALLVGELGFRGNVVPNDYRVEAYLQGQRTASCEPLRGPVTEAIDTLFCRTDCC